VKPREVLDSARQQVAELTGLPVESVSSLERDGDKNWVVTVEALELQRIPNTMDLLGSYEITISDDGEVVGFHRSRRYHRAAEDGRS
jgi:Gas vesicle synthesis protein GvpO